jgi:hypothetical protein
MVFVSRVGSFFFLFLFLFSMVDLALNAVTLKLGIDIEGPI